MKDFLLPSLGADMDQAMLVAWRVEPGEEVHKGQILAEVETDKGIQEVECWDDGVIAELVVQPGPEQLRVGTVLAHIRLKAEPAPVEAEATAGPEVEAHPPLITPPLRHLAHRLGVDLTRITGSGPGGALTHEDIEQAAPLQAIGIGRAKASPRARDMAAKMGIDIASVEATRPDGLVVAEDLQTRREPAEAPPTMTTGTELRMKEPEDRLAAMRRAVARSMARSKREIPHYYLGTDIDLAVALRWLEEQNSDRPITGRILPAALLLKATALAVRQVPDVNGHWIDDHFQPAAAVHLGVAVSLREGGLVAPAIHNADCLDLEEMMDALRDLVTRARSWRMRTSEMSDPTITVTNLGDRGVETTFPVIIPPQVAIVGYGKIVDKPVAVDGMLTVHPVVNATLAGDHRVTDGHRGGLFLVALEKLLQEPDRL